MHFLFYSFYNFHQNFSITTMEIHAGPLQKNTSYFPTLSSEFEPEEFEVDRPVLANLQAEPGLGMSPGCINKAKEICNYESGLEIHGCPRHLHPLSPIPSSSVTLSDVSAYPHHRVRAEFHGGCAAGKVEGSTADEYANPGAVPVPASRLPTKQCTIPVCGFALATFSAREVATTEIGGD